MHEEKTTLNSRSRGLPLFRGYFVLAARAHDEVMSSKKTALVMYVCLRIPVLLSYGTGLVTCLFKSPGILERITSLEFITTRNRLHYQHTNREKKRKQSKAKERTLHNNVFKGQI